MKKKYYQNFRILKPGGKAYVDIVGKGGLIGNFVMKTMRDEYKENRSFKEYIEKDLSVNSLKKVISGMKDAIEKIILLQELC